MGTMMFFRKYWLEVLMAILAAALGIYIVYLNVENRELKYQLKMAESEIRTRQAYIDAQNAVIRVQEAEYDKKMKELPSVMEKIHTEYKTKYETIYIWRDSNGSHDCNESMQYLNRFQF